MKPVLRKRVEEFRSTALKELDEQRNDLVQEMEDLVGGAKEEKRTLTEEEQTKYNELKKKIKDIDETQKITDEARDLGKKKEKKKVNPAGKGKSEDEKRTLLDSEVEELRTAMNTGTGNEGGYAVKTTLSSEIIKELKERSDVYSFFDATSEAGDYEFLRKTESGKATWVGEKTSPDANATGSIPKFEKVTLKQHRLYRESALTQHMINSQAIDLTAFIKDDISDSMLDAIEDAILFGTGTDQPTGVVSKIKADKKVTMTTRGTITTDDLKRVKAKIKRAGHKDAAWFMHSETLLEIDLLKDGDGRPLLQPDLTKESDYTVLGLPVKLSDSMPTFAKAGLQCVIMLASKRAYHTNTQRKIVLNTYDDSMYKRAGMIGYGADMYMDGKDKDVNLLAGIFNPAESRSKTKNAEVTE